MAGDYRMAMLRTVVLVSALVLAIPVVNAEEEKETLGVEKHQIDTEHLFGFMLGSDIGEVGEKEIQPVLLSRFEKRPGFYRVFSPQLEYEFVPMENLRLSPGASFAHYNISGVTGLDDRTQWAGQSASFDARYRFIDRERAGFGFAIDAEPHWNRVDETSGEQIEGYGADISIIFDKELVPNQVMSPFNVVYSPDVSRLRATGLWSRESTAGFAAGVMYRVGSVMLGAEARYLRKYESLGLNNFAGQAFFVGPTAFVPLNDPWSVTISWTIQAAGRAVGVPGSLDLTNFERQAFRMEFDLEF
jgi:hypothetical protein